MGNLPCAMWHLAMNGRSFIHKMEQVHLAMNDRPFIDKMGTREKWAGGVEVV
jgi:hypothetical protein